MSDSKNDGGAAFPTGTTAGHYSQQGMSLLDWFAGQAVSGACGPAPDGWSLSPRDTAAWAYQIADAMIAERAALQAAADEAEGRKDE